MSKIKISLCIPIKDNAHLLKRSIETYCWQDFPKSEYELIFCDDNSPDNAKQVVDYCKDKGVNYTYIRIEHPHGWRGCTVSFNTMFQMARGEVIAETTAETMLQPECLRLLYEPHTKEDRVFVAMKTYNLRPETQVLIDTVDWRENLYNIKNLEGFNDPFTLNNVKTENFVTHQTCSIRKKTFLDIMPYGRFPMFSGYGEEDPWYSNRRDINGVRGITIHEPMPIHQWHPSAQWHMAHQDMPLLNKDVHAISNYMNDLSGEVPEGGGSEMWSGKDNRGLTEEEKKSWRDLLDKWVKATGGYFYDD